jgi:predicted nucleic acid-binding protein
VKVPWRYRNWLRHKHIAFDTSILIQLLEDTSPQENRITRIFKLLEQKSLTLVTSTITLLEILVHPYRLKNLEAVNHYYGYLTCQDFISLVPVTQEIADKAAELRAKYNFRTPDAIQLATALTQRTTLFLTHDRDFRRQKEIELAYF